ncbi:hypothetical protein [Gilvibacter sediminis]|uniref:hypothetical protein n=1 Tax=Gilvibacter sediminis TaxID=379071 RepID=UPI00235043FF|nr:hypothetical protein [Gilvibacter sediminis]
MLTRIFATSKPLNFLWVSLYLLLIFALDWFYTCNRGYDIWAILEFLSMSGLLIFSILLVDFIVRKNELSKKNSFVVVAYSFLLAMIPISKLELTGVVAHVLVLMAIRRIISLQSLKSVKKKLYDATFWIAIAALAWYGAGGILLLVFVGVLLFDASDYRNWLVPFFAVLTVGIIYLAGFWVINDQLPQYFQLQDWNFDLSEFKSMQTAWPAAYLLALSAVVVPAYWLGFRKIMLIRKKRQLFIVFAAIVAWLVAFGVQPAQTQSLIFLMFPLGVALANLTERNQQRPITEILLWAFLLLPFAARTVI